MTLPAGTVPRAAAEEARLRQNALLAAAHADPSRPVPVGTAVGT